MRDAVELAGPLRTPLRLAQWKRASYRGEAGTSDFLSVSDSSSVIQFMTHAKVKVDPSLRVVEVASGNPEEMTVSTMPPLRPPTVTHSLLPRVKESG